MSDRLFKSLQHDRCNAALCLHYDYNIAKLATSTTTNGTNINGLLTEPLFEAVLITIPIYG